MNENTLIVTICIFIQHIFYIISGCLVTSVFDILIPYRIQRIDVFTFQSRPSIELNNPSGIRYQYRIQLPSDGK